MKAGNMNIYSNNTVDFQARLTINKNIKQKVLNNTYTKKYLELEKNYPSKIGLASYATGASSLTTVGGSAVESSASPTLSSLLSSIFSSGYASIQRGISNMEIAAEKFDPEYFKRIPD